MRPRVPSRRRRPPRHLLALLGLLVTGCAVRQPPEPWVTRPRIIAPTVRHGVLTYDPDLPPLDADAPATPHRSRRTAWRAARALTHDHTVWWQRVPGSSLLADKVVLDRARLNHDAARLTDWFRDRGWAEATVHPRLRPAARWWVGPRDDRFITPELVVRTGPRTRLRTVRLRGETALPQALESRLRRALPHAGEASGPASLAALRDTLRDHLGAAGHPFATVRTILAPPPLDALGVPDTDSTLSDLTVHLDPGPRATVGTVSVEGARHLDTVPLLRALRRRLRTGRPWRGDVLDDLTARLSDRPDLAQAEATVTAEPSTPDEADTTVTLDERPLGETRLTPVVSAPGSVATLGVQFDWARRLLGGRAITFDGTHQVGWRFFEGPAGALFRGVTHGPTTLHTLGAEGGLHPLGRAALRGQIQGGLDTQRGYAAGRGVGQLGLRWRPAAPVTVDLAYRGGAHHHFPWPWQDDAFAAAFGPSAGARRLERTWLEHAVVLDLTVETRPEGSWSQRGVRLDLSAIPWGTAGWNGEGPRPWQRYEARLQWHATAIPDRLTLVTKLAAGAHVIDDLDGGGGLLHHRFYLGGTQWMRGFGFRRLGPPGAEADLDQVMPGGDAMLLASLEARVSLHPDLLLAPFFDVGRTWESVRDRVSADGTLTQRGIHLADLQPTTGLGVVIRTPLGGLVTYTAVRLLEDPQLDARLARVALHVGLTEDF